MAVTAADIKFYKASADNGGTIGTEEIVSGTLNNLLDDVTGAEAEVGVTKHYKFFVKNTNASDDASTVTISLASFTDGGDNVKIFPGTSDDTTDNFDDSKLFGVAHATGELDRGTKVIPIEVENDMDPTTLFASGDRIVFADSSTYAKIVSATVASVSSGAITVNEDIPADIVLDDSYIGNAIEVATLASGASVGVWIKQSVPAYTQPMEDPADRFVVLVAF